MTTDIPSRGTLTVLAVAAMSEPAAGFAVEPAAAGSALAATPELAPARAAPGSAARPAPGRAPTEENPCMDEAAFRGLYERTAKLLWGYLRRVSGDASAADDLLQEAFARILQAPIAQFSEAHQKNYLFRVASNLLNDRFRGARHAFAPLPEMASGERVGHDATLRTDMQRFLAQLSLRERSLLWLAYVEGHAHAEIAAALGCKPASIRPMLFRARAKLAGLVRAGGWRAARPGEEKS